MNYGNNARNHVFDPLDVRSAPPLSSLPEICPPQGGLAQPATGGPWQRILPLCREVKAGNERPRGGRPEPCNSSRCLQRVMHRLARVARDLRNLGLTRHEVKRVVCDGVNYWLHCSMAFFVKSTCWLSQSSPHVLRNFQLLGP